MVNLLMVKLLRIKTNYFNLKYYRYNFFIEELRIKN